MESKYQWQYEQTPEQALVNQFAKANNLQVASAQLLLQRGIKTSDALKGFLNSNLADLYDPYLLYDMDKGIERIQQALMDGELITIYGDYDVDGLTSTTVLFEALSSLGAEVNTYIPNRFEDGYGPNEQVYRRLIEQGTQLIVTVDNGVSGKDAVEVAKALGVDVVITDHHELPAVLPEAAAVIHPRHPEGKYPFGDLSGVGVAFKVATALLEEVPVESLDLVALGTIADLVSLTDENRTLVSYGIKQLQQSNRLGIQEICKVAGIHQEEIDSTKVGFTIAPRLNALGRMGDANEGVTLLSTFDPTEAENLAEKINRLNTERQGLVKEISQVAIEMANSPENQQRKVLILAHEGWHEGVLGIVASRIVEITGKPTIVLNIDVQTGIAKGSGRSVLAFHLFNAIDADRSMLMHFGGHHMAVGLSLKADQLTVFQTALDEQAVIQKLVIGKPVLLIDEKIQVGDVSLDLIQELASFGPFGTDNQDPVFEIIGGQATNIKTLGAEAQHLKFQLTEGLNKLAAIGFNVSDDAKKLTDGTNLNVVGTLNENRWQNQSTPQLMLKDLGTSGTQFLDHRTMKLTAQLFKETGTYVFFQPKYFNQLKNYISEENQTLLYKPGMQFDFPTIILVDLPERLADLTELIAHHDLEQVMAIFYTKHPVYLEGMPDKTEYTKFLKYLIAHPEIPLREQLPAVSKFLQLKVWSIVFMYQVFFELGFVKIANGRVSTVAQMPKHELSSATSYQARVAQMAIEAKLIYSKPSELSQWFEAISTDGPNN